MPLSKYHIRNEYTLADPELYRSADKDDPEALLEGVSMAGLVGVLRQLGDLAEWVFVLISWFCFGPAIEVIVLALSVITFSSMSAEFEKNKKETKSNLV